MLYPKNLYLTIAIVICTLIMESCSPQPAFSRPNIIHTPDVIKEPVRLLWSVNEVYTSQNDFQSMVSASSGLVCVMGDLAYPPQNELTCLEGVDGTIEWQKTIRVPNGIFMDPDGVYVSNGGIAGLHKFDHSGKLEWDLSLTETTVKYMYPYDDQLQLFLLPEKFMTLDKDNGDKIAVIDGERIIYGTETERFVINYSLESRSLDLKDVNWKLDISSNNIRLAPLFTDKLILLRTGRVIGTLLAVDRITGQISWKTENIVISNIAYWSTKNVLFVLTQSGQLLEIDIDSGEESVLLSFSPAPFVLYGDAIVGGYELALDESNNILFVLLGDSRQLFAFKLE